MIDTFGEDTYNQLVRNRIIVPPALEAHDQLVQKVEKDRNEQQILEEFMKQQLEQYDNDEENDEDFRLVR